MARRNAHFRRRFNASGPLERVLILIVLAAAIGVTIGLLLPQVSSDAAKITGGSTDAFNDSMRRNLNMVIASLFFLSCKDVYTPTCVNNLQNT